jgi:beta-mannosidase
VRGRIRGVTGHTRIAVEHGWEVAPTPAGQLAGPHELDRVRWYPAHAMPDHDRDSHDWWFRAPLDPELTAGCVLGTDGIATLWDAWIDGVHVAAGDNMWAAREAPLAHGAKELVIRCRSLTAELAKKRPRPRWKVPMLEHQQLRWIRTSLLGRTPGWSPSTPEIGPWRGVWLEQRVHRVGDVVIDARLDGDTGIVAITGDFDATRAHAIVGDVRAELALVDGRWRGEARIAHANKWWPHTHGEPALYAVSIETDAFTIDLGATGFRTIELADDMSVRVNGATVFCRGACWTPVRDCDAAIRQAASCGMNMLRVGGTMHYETDAFYDALDAHGVLLWHDLMFANMDYPDELADVVRAEVREQAARWQARPSLAVVCGNSEGEQQAAMFGASRDRWAPPLFHAVIPEVLRDVVSRVPYVPSSATRGAFPHASNVGPSSYYGVGAYMRPLDDARRAEARFASECLAFANVPEPGALPAERRVHHAAWKAAGPRDLGAGWDFDDVRDHYVQQLFGVDPAKLRYAEHERYLALGRVATGEVMARTFGEWRRARSVTRGGLVWFLRDLQLGAGWGVVDANGAPKPAWWIVRRALQPLAVAITDEGTNGLALHVANDRGDAITGALELVAWRDGTTEVARASREVTVPARGAIEVAAGSLFDHFVDLNWAYKFGPPVAHAVRATFAGASAWHFPAGMSVARGAFAATVDGTTLTVRAAQLAQFVAIELPAWRPDDNYFHLAPGETRSIALAPIAAPSKARGVVTALNSDAAVRIEVGP